jgi:hypothetical protein
MTLTSRVTVVEHPVLIAQLLLDGGVEVNG